MNTLTLTVNGQSVQKPVSDRTHLGDFLRDVVQLTGTHLGCEHGVCGACTVLLDGEPVRACITYAIACEGRSITTIEGYDVDPVMSRLRAAFQAHHALQCGFCTPGMLATARDIILRLPQADERRVRIELAGNLCRCTGYTGIVSAILVVLQDLRDHPDAQVQDLRDALAKVAEHRAAAVKTAAQQFVSVSVDSGVKSELARKSAQEGVIQTQSDAQLVQQKGTTVSAAFEIPFAVNTVWAFMSDLKAVASCLPGAQIDSETPEQVAGKIGIKFGPMAATFKGSATIERDETGLVAVLKGTGQDSVSQSRASGDVRYQLLPLGASHTRVTVDLRYTLKGPLAQFSRSGLVQEFVRRMVTDFGKNVALRLQHPENAAPQQVQPINPVGMFLAILWQKIKNLFKAG